MFEILFNHSPAVFRKGEFVLLGEWPIWLLLLLILAAVAGLGWGIYRQRADFAPGMSHWRPAVIWLLQGALVGLVLLLLWQPALRVATLKPQQNIVAVVLDDSRSMAIEENGTSRSSEAVRVLDSGLLDQLSERFQVRLYRMGGGVERIQAFDNLAVAKPATRIGDSLSQLVAESASLPIGAVVLMSDGADNSGGVSPGTIAELRSRRIPVHTVGFGREQFDHDVEIVDVETPDRALADSRLMARVTLRQNGYDGRPGRVTIRQDGRILASEEFEFAAAGQHQNIPLMFHAGEAGPKRLDVGVELLANEENERNNSTSRVLNVEDSKPNILYVEGEPRWEFKFIRRAVANDASVRLVSMLRTTQNKIYRQGIDDPDELKNGFPGRVDELFEYEGLVIGSVEASYFDTAQQELIRQFADRRGGGVLFLGGRSSLADGGWETSDMADMLPVSLSAARGITFHRDQAAVELSFAGSDSLITRLDEDPRRNEEVWARLPRLADYQEVGDAKPGASVLAEAMPATGRELPLLITQSYGHGRTAVFATSGSWRWQMSQPLEDQTHEIFWRQLLRWLVTGTPGRVTVSVPKQMLFDEGRVELTATVRDKTYAPASDAKVEARILGPDGTRETIELSPDATEPGTYHADWTAVSQGSFVAEVVAFRQGGAAASPEGNSEVVGRDVITLQRMDGVAENFRVEQNRELLEKLSTQTGGRYYSSNTAGVLADEISFSEAGITVRETKDLWNMPIVFLALLAIKAAEWLLRRKWGVV